MPRDGQPAAYDAALAADGFRAAQLFDFTLRDGAEVRVADLPVIVSGQPYEPDGREINDLRFSEGDNVDGMSLPLQNVDGIFGFTDEEGASPLEGARVVFRRAVSPPDTTAWAEDTLGHFIVLSVEEINQTEVRLALVPDYADPSKQMSSETVFLAELSPVAAEVAGVGGGTLTGGGGGDEADRTGGFRGGYFDYNRDSRLNRDYLPANYVA
jgi:hypothetical protein